MLAALVGWAIESDDVSLHALARHAVFEVGHVLRAAVQAADRIEVLADLMERREAA